MPYVTDSLEGHRVVGYFSTSPQGWTFATAFPQSRQFPPVPKAVRDALDPRKTLT